MSISNEINNKGFNNQLFECSLLVVSLLLNQYKAKVINLSEFKSHTSNKILYILNNYETIKDNIQKKTIENLVNECIEINNAYKSQ